MNKIQNILFDLDGTLLNSYDLKLRLSIVFEAARAWGAFGKTLKAFDEMKRALESAPNSETNDVKATRAFARVFELEEPTARTLLEKSILDIFPRMKKNFYPVPDAREFLEWSCQNYQIYLATNPVWIPEIVELRVKWAGIDSKVFKSMTHAKRMHSCKPRVEYYEELLTQEKLDPATCLLVGNDMVKDLPAVYAGIKVFILENYLTAVPIDLPPTAARAWCGRYSALKNLLKSGEVL